MLNRVICLINQKLACLNKRSRNEKVLGQILLEAHGAVKQQLRPRLLWPEAPLGGAESLLVGRTEPCPPGEPFQHAPGECSCSPSALQENFTSLPHKLLPFFFPFKKYFCLLLSSTRPSLSQQVPGCEQNHFGAGWGCDSKKGDSQMPTATEPPVQTPGFSCTAECRGAEEGLAG